MTVNADTTSFYLVVEDFKFVGSNGCATFGNPVDCNTVLAVQRRLSDLQVCLFPCNGVTIADVVQE